MTCHALTVWCITIHVFCQIFFDASYPSGDHIHLLTDNTDHSSHITSLCQPRQSTQTGYLPQYTGQNINTARVRGQIPLGPVTLTMAPWHLISLQQTAYVCTICCTQVASQVCRQRLIKVEY